VKKALKNRFFDLVEIVPHLRREKTTTCAPPKKEQTPRKKKRGKETTTPVISNGGGEKKANSPFVKGKKRGRGRGAPKM